MPNDKTIPAIKPAPDLKSMPHLTGKCFVSKGTGEFAQYLQPGGTWGKPAYYFDSERQAKSALGDQEFRSELSKVREFNIAADLVVSRLLKQRRRL